MGTCPPAKPELQSNQGQIPAVYSRSLCQLLRKSEQMPPTGISRAKWKECGNGFGLVVCVRGDSVRSKPGAVCRMQSFPSC